MHDEGDRLAGLLDRYGRKTYDDELFALYKNDDPRLRPMLAYLHTELNQALNLVNSRRKSSGRLDAVESRELSALMREVDEAKELLGEDLSLDEAYEKRLSHCRRFLNEVSGSSIPFDYDSLLIVRYNPIFKAARIKNKSARSKPLNPSTVNVAAVKKTRHPLQIVGEGAYAKVFKYFDEERDQHIALKRARDNLSEKELDRFRAEFKLLKELNFPYVVDVYAYNERDNSYTMEYCQSTLLQFINKNNQTLKFSARKRIAQQFLYGVNYLHLKNVLHRDISLRNILLKEYDFLAVAVKLSDFGLYKGLDSGMTSIGSSMKGSFIDPTLDDFRNFDVHAEIYAIGRTLSFIFSGRQNLGECTGRIQDIIERCTSLRRRERYSKVIDIIHDVDLVHDSEDSNSGETTGSYKRFRR